MIRPARRRAMTLLVAAPLVCGLLLAGGIAAAWLALGEPVPAHGAVWFQVTKLGAARYYVTVFLFLSMMSLPLKMLARWIFNLKYVVAIPEIFFNI